MAYQVNEARANEKNAKEGDRRMKKLWKYACTVICAVAAIIAYYKENFEIDILSFLQEPAIVFTVTVLFIAVIAVFLEFIYDHFKTVSALKSQITSLRDSESCIADLNSQIANLNLENERLLAQTNTLNKKSDSIMDMLTYANNNKQYSEVIKIGTSISDVLWSTSRKELRIKVGNMVAAAANELATISTNDADIDYANHILAKTMIEDIGNTKMCLNTANVDEAIINIQDGIDIAKKHGYHYETVRGHRNLANCYALKAHLFNKSNNSTQAANELEHAQQEATLAKQAIQLIQDPQKNAEANFDVEYAHAKIAKEKGKPEEAVNALNRCIQVYKDALHKDGTAKHVYADRLVKIYREMGIIYQSISGKHKDARNAFQEGLQHAKSRQNHEDIVRCCTHLIDLQIKYRFADTAETVQHWIHDAEKNCTMVDTQKHIDDFKEAKQRWECQNNVP